MEREAGPIIPMKCLSVVDSYGHQNRVDVLMGKSFRGLLNLQIEEAPLLLKEASTISNTCLTLPVPIG